jgi:ABC-type Fe3+-hydroxamate transport system substrate-binding protein
VAAKAKVGREKDPDLEKIRGLAPDLVVANVEENRRDVVEQLRAWGIPVWVTFPRTVRAGIDLVRELGEVTGVPAEGAALADRLERRYAARVAENRGRPVRVFCPIWRGPYMTIARDTYVHDMLAVCGGANVFAERAERYPTVTLAEVAAAAPEVILLPDEPFRFRPPHLADFAPFPEIPAIVAGRTHFVDGKLLAWYGPRIADALEKLPGLLASRA